MLVSELLQRLDNGETMKKICAELNVNPTTLQRRFKKSGYTFNNFSKRWEWTGSGKEQININLLEVINKPISSRMNLDSPNGEIKVKSSSLSIHTLFTQDEIQSLKEMIQDGKKGVRNKKRKPDHEELYDRIKTLKPEEKTRKTIVINKSISQSLDEFTKREKINKSDVLHLALEDFIKNYS